MVRTMHKWLLSVAILLLGVQASFAQTSGVPMTVTTLPGSSVPQSYFGGSTSTLDYHSLEDRNGSILVGNPDLDGPRYNLGWFATVDVDLLGSHVDNKLNNTVSVFGTIAPVALPSANLNWTASPRFEVGYRFGQAAGELVLSYRFLATSGSATTPDFDPAGNPGLLRSRLAMNIIDVDYAALEPSLLPWFEMKWRVGLRVASLFFDSDEASSLLEQHVSNSFTGVGPHAALDLWHPIAASRFGIFCKVDAAGAFGTVQQGFEETITGTGSGSTRTNQFMPTIMLNVQAGIGWAPRDNWRFSFGYTYEHWWDAAYTPAPNGGFQSTGDVATQGVFFRAEWKY
jgi:hypothetical protein